MRGERSAESGAKGVKGGACFIWSEWVSFGVGGR